MKQQPTKPQPTAAQSSVIHSVQSAAQAGFISLCVGTGQYLITGSLDWHTLLTVLGAAFFGAGSMIYKSVSSNPSLAQAALDTANEAIQRVEQIAPNWLNADIAKVASKRSVFYPPSSPQAAPPALPAQPSGGGMPPDYYSRYQQPRAALPDMATQGYVPAVNPNQSMLTGAFNLAPPAQSQQSQQGG